MEDISSNRPPDTEKINGALVELDSFSSFDEMALKMVSSSRKLYLVYFNPQHSCLKSLPSRMPLLITAKYIPDIEKLTTFKGQILKFNGFVLPNAKDILFYAYPPYDEFITSSGKIQLCETESLRMETLFNQLLSEVSSKNFMFEEMSGAIMAEILLTLSRKQIVIV